MDFPVLSQILKFVVRWHPRHFTTDRSFCAYLFDHI